MWCLLADHKAESILRHIVHEFAGKNGQIYMHRLLVSFSSPQTNAFCVPDFSIFVQLIPISWSFNLLNFTHDIIYDLSHGIQTHQTSEGRSNPKRRDVQSGRKRCKKFSVFFFGGHFHINVRSIFSAALVYCEIKSSCLWYLLIEMTCRRWTLLLPLSLPLNLAHSGICTDKGGNLCTRKGVVFATGGGSMVIALHIYCQSFL